MWQIHYVRSLLREEPYLELYRAYLAGCEYIQIDPTKAYSIEFIEKRVQHVLSQWGENDDRKTVKDLHTALEAYLKLMRATRSDPHGFFPMLIGPGEGQHAFKVNMFYKNNKTPEKYKTTMSEHYAKKISEFIEKKDMELHEGTISEEYVKKEPTQHNFRSYAKGPRRPFVLPDPDDRY